MRLWVWLLVLLNVGLLVYFNMDTLAPKAQVVRTEVNPEKLKLLLDEDFANLTKKEYVPPSVAKSCYKWGKFTTASLPAAQEVIANLGLAAEVIEEAASNQERRFWIYYPPLATPELAQSKAEEIKRLGVDELYIVQDSQWRNAISFGLFSEEPLATALLKELKAKGVKNAVKSLRSHGTAGSSLLAKDVSSEAAVELYKVRPEFVGTEVRPVPCP
ncbi:MAG: sporulation protein [Methylophilaceae bacterium]